MSSYEQFAYSYDSLTSNVDYQKRGEYFHNIIKKYNPNGEILVDLACGTGSLSEYFARLNYEVIATDASEEMLAVAIEKKYENQNDIMYLHQSMQELDLFGTVDIVICALDSINHVTDKAEVQQIFDKISLFLNDGAIFIFDVNTIYKHQKVLANNTFVYDCEDVYCVWQNTLRADNIIDINLDIFEYDEESSSYERFVESFSERAYSDDEIKAFIKNSGFTLLEVYGDDTFEAVCDTTQRAIYVCKMEHSKNATPNETE